MFDQWRRQLWHLRHGGPTAVTEHRRRRDGQQPRTNATLTRRGRHHTFEPYTPLDRPVRHETLNVAVILDDFSTAAFAPEWNQILVTPANWRQVLSTNRIDMLFVESAWHGNGKKWTGRLTGPSAPNGALIELVSHCQAHRIPTVFWNKEDPTHHEDFLPTARLFDYVFTTDGDLLDAYRTHLGHDNIGVLPFAAQPVLHNPIRLDAGQHERDIAFAGMYFAHRHDERREQMDVLLNAACDVARDGATFDIWSRQLGGDANYQFPGEFDKHVAGSLSYDRMLTAYRGYKTFLNVNTVTTSPTMCARRVFELSASGAVVVSTPSEAIAETFTPDEVVTITDREHARRTLTTLLSSEDRRDRIVHRAQRRIWAQHTYAHRVDTILTTVGIDRPTLPAVPSVSVLAVTKRPSQLDHLLQQVAQQVDVDIQLVVVAHGWPPPTDLADTAKNMGIARVTVAEVISYDSLGKCLNRAVDLAVHEYVAKFDDDDVYGPHYLADQIAALRYSGADVVGKRAHYMYLAGADLTIRRFSSHEHRFTDLVMGPTLVTTRALAMKIPFADVTRGEDTTFLRDVAATGGRIYAADRFNFLQRRAEDPNAHTWDVEDAELLSAADEQHTGFQPDLIIT